MELSRKIIIFRISASNGCSTTAVIQPPALETADSCERFAKIHLSLPNDAHGSVVELDGQAVACVMPPPKPTNGTAEAWTEAKNNRRCDLIDQEFDGPPLTPAEVVELAELQEEMLRYRQRVASLPLDDARQLHQELLAKVAAQ